MNETLHSNTDAIASRLGVGKKTVFRWIQSEGLPAFKEKNSKTSPYMILESSLSTWLKQFEKKHQKPPVKRKT